MFVSSTLDELAAERAVAREAIEGLRFTPVLFELGARPHPPRALYRAYLEQSHVFVGIYWQRYGWVAPEMDVSGIEDELALAGATPKLVYVKQPADDREPRLQALLDGVVRTGVSFRRFGTPEELGALLRDDLALLVSERFEARPPTPPAPPVVIPAPASSFVGREHDLASLEDLLRRPDVRLLTLTGAGGIGKSRLAFEAARGVVGAYPDGIVSVLLAPLADPGEVLAAVAEAFDVSIGVDSSVAESLRDHLGGREVLLVLDNMEHVLPAAPAVGELLTSVPGLTVLATSRVRLDISGEHVVRVSPLALPAAAERAPEEIRRSDAVRLFVLRAEAAGWTTGDADLELVAEIVRRLDGLPLAIELAAAQARLVPAELIHARLRQRLDLGGAPMDADPRHRTLRDAIDWSYDLLDEPARRFFEALSMFSGGFTVEAAAEVAGDGDGAFELLASLVDSSLVVAVPGRGPSPRFDLLDVIHEYAHELLTQHAAVERTALRHLAYFARLAEDAHGALSSEAPSARSRLDGERENLRVAYASAMQLRPEEAVRLSGALGVYFSRRGLLREGREAIARALEAAPQAPSAWRARALLHGGWLAAEQDDCGMADRMAQQALDLYRSLDDRRGIGGSLNTLGYSAATRGDDERAIELYEQAYRVFSETEHDFVRFYAGVNLATVLTARDDVESARGFFSEALEYFDANGFEDEAATVRFRLGELEDEHGDAAAAKSWYAASASAARAIGNVRLLAWVLMRLAHLEATAGSTGDACASYAEALGLHQDLGDRPGLAYCLEHVADLALAGGSPEVAARLLGGSRALRAVGSTPVSAAERAELLRTEELVRDALGAGTFELVCSEGEALATAELVALAEGVLTAGAPAA